MGAMLPRHAVCNVAWYAAMHHVALGQVTPGCGCEYTHEGELDYSLLAANLDSWLTDHAANENDRHRSSERPRGALDGMHRVWKLGALFSVMRSRVLFRSGDMPLAVAPSSNADCEIRAAFNSSICRHSRISALLDRPSLSPASALAHLACRSSLWGQAPRQVTCALARVRVRRAHAQAMRERNHYVTHTCPRRAGKRRR